ncbi:hypothetical protein SDC9_167859 [bioreactor metagenome]|uniref:Uncharacterized protein n=1 Tax=bioreactor metagenome TaxID=1076179 RepID=A0A645G3I6_9ZZZZ
MDIGFEKLSIKKRIACSEINIETIINIKYGLYTFKTSKNISYLSITTYIETFKFS